MGIIERVRQLNLPDGQFVVIGSGVMDALGLRQARDIDLVVKPKLFEELKSADGWTMSLKHNEEVLEHDDQEVWLSWGSKGQPNFKDLYEGGITIEGIRFAHPRVVLAWKQTHPSPKNTEDMAVLQAYLEHDA